LNRHVYAGSGSATGKIGAPLPWARKLHASPGSRSALGSESPSPRSEGGKTHGFDDDDEDMLFDGPKDSSFVFSVMEGTPSPRNHSVIGGAWVGLKKYKPGDLGIVMGDDECSVNSSMNMGIGGTFGASGSLGWAGDFLSVMPHASTSVDVDYNPIIQLSTVSSSMDFPFSLHPNICLNHHHKYPFSSRCFVDATCLVIF